MLSFTKFTGKHFCQSLLSNKVAGVLSATLLNMRLWHSCVTVNLAKFLRVSTMLHMVTPCRSSHQRCSMKKVFLEISQNSQENTYARVPFLIKLQVGLELVFLCEFCEISKKHIFHRTPLGNCFFPWTIKKWYRIEKSIAEHRYWFVKAR